MWEIREAEVRQKQEALNDEFRKWIGVFGEDVGLDGFTDQSQIR